MKYRSLYIHVPFCASICDYCAFYTFEKADSIIRNRFLERLNEELERKRELCTQLETIYIGGGTPTVFSNLEIERLLKILNNNFSYASNYEFTIEGTPDTITKEKLQLLLDGGVNRFSIGVQSFSKKIRERIGRPGTINRICKTMDLLKSKGVQNFNCDLIYGVADQSISDWEYDIQKIVSFDSPHVSTYCLSIEKNTVLAEKGESVLDDNTQVEMQNLASTHFGNITGLNRYEISNYSKPGFECKHNLKAWQGVPFLGAGPSASYFDGVSRWNNPISIWDWLKDCPPTEDYLDSYSRALEILVTGLRITRGWDRDLFKRTTGFDFFNLRREKIEDFIKMGYLKYEESRLRLTEDGLLVADSIGSELL